MKGHQLVHRGLCWQLSSFSFPRAIVEGTWDGIGGRWQAVGLVFMSTLGPRDRASHWGLQSLSSVGEATVDDQQCGLWISDVLLHCWWGLGWGLVRMKPSSGPDAAIEADERFLVSSFPHMGRIDPQRPMGGSMGWLLTQWVSIVVMFVVQTGTMDVLRPKGLMLRGH